MYLNNILPLSHVTLCFHNAVERRQPKHLCWQTGTKERSGAEYWRLRIKDESVYCYSDVFQTTSLLIVTKMNASWHNLSIIPWLLRFSPNYKDYSHHYKHNCHFIKRLLLVSENYSTNINSNLITCWMIGQLRSCILYDLFVVCNIRQTTDLDSTTLWHSHDMENYSVK